MPLTSPAVTRQEAVVTQIKTIGMLAGRKAYQEGDVPRGAALPHVVYGTDFEDRDGSERGTDRYGERGHNTATLLKCWGQDLYEAKQVYAALVAALDGVLLPLTGHKAVQCQVSLLRTFAEPDPEVGGHVAVAVLRMGTRQT